MTIDSRKSEYVTRTEFGEYMFKTDRKFEDLTTIMLGEFDKVYVKFGEINKKFEEIDRRFDAIESRFDALEKTVNTKLGVILDHLVSQDQSIQSILTYIKK